MAKMVKLSAMQNVVGNRNEDRLSSLPDALLHHIFSFLDTQHVVQTSLLSKKWTHFWSSFPFLNLSSKNNLDFLQFSHSVLFHRDVGAKVDTLRVRCSVDFSNNVNSWIIFVSKLNVQVLDIQFDRPLVHNNGAEQSLSFTHCIYKCVSLRVLKLDISCYYYYYDKLNLPNHVSLPCLEIIYFKKIEFVDDCFSRLISSCPRLKSLTMCDCKFPNNLVSLSCPQLETLVICDYTASFLSFQVSAICLTSLDITNWYTTIDSVTISDFPYLLNAKINAKFCSLASYFKVLNAVRNMQSLNISFDLLLEDMLENEPHEDKWFPCLYDNLKHIKLETQFRTREVFVIIQLLKASTNLETFILNNCNEDYVNDPTDFFPCSSEFNLDRLTQVEFDDFHGMEDELNLVRFFICNAKNLKKLTLVSREWWSNAVELAEVARALIECSRPCNFSYNHNGKRDPSLIATFT